MAPVGVSGFLVHRDGDSVGVAVTDLTPGPVRGSSLSNPDISISIEVTEPIPLGHKLAITTIGQGQEVVEYGACVAVDPATATARPLSESERIERLWTEHHPALKRTAA